MPVGTCLHKKIFPIFTNVINCYTQIVGGKKFRSEGVAYPGNVFSNGFKDTKGEAARVDVNVVIPGRKGANGLCSVQEKT